MNRIPLPALIIVTMTAALLAVIVWTLTAAPDTSPPELPTMTAPPPSSGPADPYPAPPTVAPYPAPYPPPVYPPFQAPIGPAYP